MHLDIKNIQTIYICNSNRKKSMSDEDLLFLKEKKLSSEIEQESYNRLLEVIKRISND